MNKRLKAIAIGVFFIVQASAFAHEGEKHTKGHKNSQMDKLHKMMPMYTQAQSKIDEALINGDTATVKMETGKILATIPDLKKATPHKNHKQTATFRKLASAFGGDIKKTATLVKTGDLAGAKDAFQFAKLRCNECHAKFRD